MQLFQKCYSKLSLVLRRLAFNQKVKDCSFPFQYRICLSLYSLPNRINTSQNTHNIHTPISTKQKEKGVTLSRAAAVLLITGWSCTKIVSDCQLLSFFKEEYQMKGKR